MSHIPTSAPCHHPSQFPRVRHWVPFLFRLQDRALLAETSRGQHSAAQTCWVQSTPCLRGCRLNKDHQLSPNSVPDIVENPFPMKKWRLPQDHLFYNFKIATKSHHFMNETWVPETCPHLPTCMSSGAGYRVHVYLLPPNPAGASFRFSFSLKPQCLCPPSKGSLTHDLTWQP